MNLRDQDGGALLFVTMVGLVISLGFGLFMGSTVVGESRAIEAQLARSRAYWAEMGAFNYGLSRIAASKFCNGCFFQSNIKDTDLAPILQAYFNELSNYRVWTYLDESADYSITTSVTAAADDRPGRHNFSGWLMATSAYTPSALVASSAGALPQMELRVCVGRAYSGDECGNIDDNNGGNATSYYSVNRLTNLPLP